MGVLSDMFVAKSGNKKVSIKQGSFRLTDKGNTKFEDYINTGNDSTTDALVMFAITESGSHSLNSLEKRLGVRRDRIERSLERLARNRYIAPARVSNEY